MKVVMTQELYDEMVEHCLAGRPNEACGILASRGGRVVRVFNMSNAAASPLRYSLDPKEQFAVYKQIDEDGLELGGVYHSHTRTLAYPSPTDVRMASEDVPYLIVSFARPTPEVKAFRIEKSSWTDEEGEISEIPIEVTG